MLEVWVSPFVVDIQLTYELCQVGFLIMWVPHFPRQPRYLWHGLLPGIPG